MAGHPDRSFEPWMVSNVATGAAQQSYMTLLIPPFITSVTGSALRSGIVLAVVGLAALTGPYIGRFADRRNNHRLLYVLSIFGFFLSFLLLAVDANADVYSPIIGLLFGVSIAAQGTIGPAFIVGSGQSQRLVAGQLTMFGLSIPLGQLIGAVIIAIGLGAGLSSRGLFVLAALSLLIAALWTWLTVAKPAKRLADFAAQVNIQKRKHTSSRQIYLSAFGLFLLAATVGAIANSGLYSQVANILPAVYGYSAQQTSLVVALAGLLSIGAIILSGSWMRRLGSYPVYIRGAAIKFVGMVGMAVVALLGGGFFLIAALMVQLAYVGPMLTRTASSDVSVKLAPVTSAEAAGYYLASSALGAFLGSLAAGALADFVGYNAVNWMNALLSGAAVAILVVFLLPWAKSFKALFVTT